MSTEAALPFAQARVEATPSGEPHAVAERTVPYIDQPSPDISSDETLLKFVQSGSKEALSNLFLRHGRAVFNVGWKILRDNSEADDLRQEVFLYMFEKAKLFDARKGSATSWIMQVAYHRVGSCKLPIIVRLIAGDISPVGNTMIRPCSTNRSPMWE